MSAKAAGKTLRILVPHRIPHEVGVVHQHQGGDPAGIQVPDGAQHVFEGIESCVDALNGLFIGANIGKTVVKVAEPTPV